MIQVRAKAKHISNKYKIHIESIQFKWYRFLPILEKDFSEILSKVLNHKSTVTTNKLKKNRSTLNENREQYIEE